MHYNQEQQYDKTAALSGENSFKDFLSKYLPFWPLFVAGVLISVGAAWAILRYTVPIYRIQSTILFREGQNVNRNQPGGLLLDQLDIYISPRPIENEIEVLRSYSLMKQVISNLHLEAAVYQRGKLRESELYKTSPFRLDSIQLFRRDLEQPIPIQLISERVFRLGQKQYPLDEIVHTPFGIFKISRNKLYNSREVFYLYLHDPDQLAEQYISELQVIQPSTSSGILRLSLQDPVPQKGVDILNELVKVYIERSKEDKIRALSNALSFIDTRLQLVSFELEEVEKAVVQFKSREGIIEMGDQAKYLLAGVRNNDQKESEIRLQLELLYNIENYVRQKSAHPNGIGTVPSLAITDPVLAQLVTKLYDLELQEERLVKTTGYDNPLRKTMQAQLENIRSSILENTVNIRKDLLTALSQLKENSNRVTAAFKNVPQKEQYLLDISRQQAIKSTIYSFLLQKREEIAIASASTIASSTVIDKAKASSRPTYPVKRNYYAFALVVGLLLPALYVSGKDLMNNKILFRSEIEQQTGIPIIGEILQLRKRAEIVVESGNRTAISEQFRSIRTNLTQMAANRGAKVLLCTSNISGEGKSFVTLNLGISLSLTDKKVLLIELDIRRPKLHKTLQRNYSPGISNYLVGKAMPAAIIQSLEKYPNLFLLPSGPIPPNPTELISNGRLPVLLDSLRPRYDYILINTPPLTFVTDAQIVSAYADATIYIIRYKYTPKAFLKVMADLHNQKKLPNMYLIFNGVSGRGTGLGYTYHVGYKYGYYDGRR